MGASAEKSFRQLPAVSRERGLPSIGFELTSDLEMIPVDGRVRCCERRDGETVGELAVEVFPAALIIDRDGILEAKASELAGSPAVRISLPGATGYRAESIAPRGRDGSQIVALPYFYVFAVAPRDGIDGGILVTVRCARPEWPAAEAMLRSLRIVTRRGTIPPANDEQSDTPLLPIVE